MRIIFKFWHRRYKNLFLKQLNFVLTGEFFRKEEEDQSVQLIESIYSVDFRLPVNQSINQSRWANFMTINLINICRIFAWNVLGDVDKCVMSLLLLWHSHSCPEKWLYNLILIYLGTCSFVPDIKKNNAK